MNWKMFEENNYRMKLRAHNSCMSIECHTLAVIAVKRDFEKLRFKNLSFGKALDSEIQIGWNDINLEILKSNIHLMIAY